MAALWLVVIIGATGYELSVRSRVRRLAVANALEATAATAAADAALETVRAALENRLAHPLDANTRTIADATFDPWGDLRFIRTDTIDMGDERAAARVYDAGTRLQINRATDDDFRRLFVALRIDAGEADRLSQRILDWRDRDQFRRARGAERDEYLRVRARVLPRDADFVRVDELRDVEGITAELYTRIAPFLTVYGTGQINLNTAPEQVLASLPGLGGESIALILRAQASRRPFHNLDEVTRALSPGARSAIVDADSELLRRVTFDAREIVVEATGWLNGSPVRCDAEAFYVKGGDAMFVVSRRMGT